MNTAMHNDLAMLQAWALAWIANAYCQEPDVDGECCERLAVRAAGLMYRYQGKALQPVQWNPSLPLPKDRSRTADEVAAVAVSLAQLTRTEPLLLLKDAMHSYTGVPEEERRIF